MRTLKHRFIALRCVLLLAQLAFGSQAAVAQSATPADEDAQQRPPSINSSVSRELAPAQLLSELRRGGYVFYFRHTSTDFSQDDSKSRGPDDCGNQRNLTNQGRDEARAIGAAVRALEIPIGKIVASPLCRTMETAQLAFGRAEAMAEVRGGPIPANDPDRYAALKQLLATPQPRGANLVISSHGNPFYAVAGAPYLAEGEAAVIRGLGKNQFEIVARIRRDGWQTLAAAR